MAKSTPNQPQNPCQKKQIKTKHSKVRQYQDEAKEIKNAHKLQCQHKHNRVQRQIKHQKQNQPKPAKSQSSTSNQRQAINHHRGKTKTTFKSQSCYGILGGNKARFKLISQINKKSYPTMRSKRVCSATRRKPFYL